MKILIQPSFKSFLILAVLLCNTIITTAQIIPPKSKRNKVVPKEQLKMNVPLYAPKVQAVIVPIAQKEETIKVAFVAPNKAHYFFTKDRYFRHTKENNLEKIANTKPDWSGIPDDADAAFVSSKNNKAYFFKGSTYNRWDFKAGKDNPELAISRFWEGVPSNLDAVVEHPNGKIYFFKGDKYYRYVDEHVDKEALISDFWPGVPNHVAAALRHPNGNIYFFKGDRYYRFNVKADKVDSEGTIGRGAWRELDFERRNFRKRIVYKNLKVTLTSMEFVKGERKMDILLQQKLDFIIKGKSKKDLRKSRNFQKWGADTYDFNNKLERANNGIRAFIYPDWEVMRTNPGDYTQIVNSLVYRLSPYELADKNAKMKIYTTLKGYYLKNNRPGNEHAVAKERSFEVKVNDIIQYLQNPNSVSSDFFNRDGYHYSGNPSSVMPFKKAKYDGAVEGVLEFNNLGVTIKLYYSFELIK